jgi:hypothetical protein
VADEHVWVVDTSSLKFIKRYVNGAAHAKYVNHLSAVIEQDLLYCPPHVIDELLAFKGEDVLTAWAKENRKKAARMGKCAEKMPEAMSNKAVANCIDHRSSKNDFDPADPWIIATALTLRSSGKFVTVVTDERERYKGARASPNIAAGSMGFPAINMESYLRDHLAVWNDSDFGS